MKNKFWVLIFIAMISLLSAACQPEEVPVVETVEPTQVAMPTVAVVSYAEPTATPEKVVEVEPTAMPKETMIPVEEPQPEPIPTLSPAAEEDALAYFEKYYKYNPFYSSKYGQYIQQAILTGETDRFSYETAMGHAEVDVAWAYAYNEKAKKPVLVPVAIGVLTPDDEYIGKSTLFPSFPDHPFYQAGVTRDNHLATYLSGNPEFSVVESGKIITLVFWVKYKGGTANWDAYAQTFYDKLGVPTFNGEFGAWLDEQYPGVNEAFMNGALDEAPEGWVPWGYMLDLSGMPEKIDFSK